MSEHPKGGSSVLGREKMFARVVGGSVTDNGGSAQILEDFGFYSNERESSEDLGQSSAENQPKR